MRFDSKLHPWVLTHELGSSFASFSYVQLGSAAKVAKCKIPNFAGHKRKRVPTPKVHLLLRYDVLDTVSEQVRSVWTEPEAAKLPAFVHLTAGHLCSSHVPLAPLVWLDVSIRDTSSELHII